MAKSNGTSPGKSLVIVESPAKARTIGKFLGSAYQVEASIGHVRDLPKNADEVPEGFKKQKWARLGVNVEDGFAPVYIVPDGKKKQVDKLKAALKTATDLYLATDEDREGEAISWHLCELLNPKVPVHRLVFHEITKEAITHALESPRQIDDGLVRAQETRRIVDRLYGYEVSPLLWRKVRPRLSAGRVQSVAVRLIVDRERERRSFREATYWDLQAQFLTPQGASFQAHLQSVGGRRLPSGKDFDPATGKLKDANYLLLDATAAQALAARLAASEFQVTALEEKPFQRKPSPPFTTSTMQQEANRKLGFTAKRTMSVAQRLYENGYITYMRTDSTNLASVAVDAARDLVRSEYGADYLPSEPRQYKSKVKNAQEAHEAIRPAGHPFQLPESLKSQLNDDEFRLFELIWKRTIASQMENARGRTLTVTVEGADCVFQASGSTIDFPGFLRAYVEGSDDPSAELADHDRLLPPLREQDRLEADKMDARSHTTQPPARYTEASLTRALEERGIGRPSTYAAIIETILQRDYVFKRGTALVPTWTAFSVCQLLEEHLPNLVNYAFTAKMEDDLDAISRGEAQHVTYLNHFYFGNGQLGLKQQLENKVEEIDAREVNRFSIGRPAEEGPLGAEIFVRVGKYGPFLEQGERRASIRDEMPPDELTVEVALDLLNKAEAGEAPLGVCPATQRPVYLKEGRYGSYVQIGAPEDEVKQNASLLKGMTPADVTLEVALRLLSLPRDLGPHPESGTIITAFNGRYGPYVKCGTETRSLPADKSPLDVTLEEALELLAQPKQRGGRGAPKPPLRELEVSPVTEQLVRILDGRYGPYITDGVTNASVPKGIEIAEVTQPQALEWLAERAAQAGTRTRRGGKKKSAKGASSAGTATAKKKTTKAAKKKTTTKKKSTAKKATKKTTA